MLAGMVLLNCSVIHHHMALKSLDIYIDSNGLFEGIWDEWFNLNVFLFAREMQLDDVLYEEIFTSLPKEKQSELIGRKADFAKRAGITL